MRNDAHCGVWKVWLYAASAVALGAWISPLIFNAGKALAEVSSQKTTNAPLEKLAGICRVSEFPVFFNASLLLAAVVLFFPWMEWVHAKSDSTHGMTGPWKVRLPGGPRVIGCGQRLLKNLRGLWQGCAGFLVMSGILLSLGIALVPAGYFSMKMPPGGILPMALSLLAGVFLIAAITEIIFRGIALGIFLRSRRPPVAIAMSAGFFAIVLAVIPTNEINVTDPEASSIGFELLQKSLLRFADWKNLVGSLVPWFMLGGLLAYARWRTASLWMSVGLMSGWLFGKEMLVRLCHNTVSPEVARLFQQGLIPLIAILLTAAMVRFFTANDHDEDSAAP